MGQRLDSLSLCNVSLFRGRQRLIENLNLSLRAGEVLGVLGPNGSGKTSLLSACTGELPIRSGEIRYGNRPLDPNDAKQLARTRAVLPQQSHLTFNLPVREIIQMGAYPFPEIGRDQVRRWMDQAIDAADLSALVDNPFNALSGGEQQRVQFARVMVQTLAIAATHGQAYMFLDEPTASLDLRHQGLLLNAVRQLAQNGNNGNSRTSAAEKTVGAIGPIGPIGAFVVLHDLNIAARWCDRVLILSKHHDPVQGSPDEAFRQEALNQVYGINLRVGPHPIRPNELLVLVDD
jgi:iron complex transport system ATP-binding protein